jgi:hypothetical protein
MKMVGQSLMSAMMPKMAMESSSTSSFDGKRKKRGGASKKANAYNKANICRKGMKCFERNTN